MYTVSRSALRRIVGDQVPPTRNLLSTLRHGFVQARRDHIARPLIWFGSIAGAFVWDSG